MNCHIYMFFSTSCLPFSPFQLVSETHFKVKHSVHLLTFLHRHVHITTVYVYVHVSLYADLCTKYVLCNKGAVLQGQQWHEKEQRDGNTEEREKRKVNEVTRSLQ